MKRPLIILAGLAATGILVAGCNQATKVSSQQKSLFENSTPKIKQLFQTAQTADSQNNYLSAYTNYQAILNQKLSVDQVMAMQTVMKALTERIYSAAGRGDAGAEVAVKYMKSQQPR